MRRPFFLFMIALLLLRGWAGEAMATDMATGQVQRAPHLQVVLQTENAIETIADQSFGNLNNGFSASDVAPQLPSNLVSTTATDPDCTGHAESLVAMTSGPTSHQTGTGPCDSCAACQACHTMALSLPVFSTGSSRLPAALPRASTTQFASAFAALGQKPPIS